MNTRREAPIAAGLAKPGRGKFSGEANAWLDAQRAAGVKFSDDGMVVKNTISKPAKDKDAKSAPVRPEDTSYIAPEDYRFPESEYRAVATIDGKRVHYGMREACNNCGYSLLNHPCNDPMVHGRVVVIEQVNVGRR